MKRFSYTITDSLGIHARPAGLLAKAAKAFGDTQITIGKGDEAVRATQLMKLMALGIRQGDTVTVTAEGPDEAKAEKQMRKFFEENL